MMEQCIEKRSCWRVQFGGAWNNENTAYYYRSCCSICRHPSGHVANIFYRT